MDIKQHIETIKSDLEMFEDDLDKYEYIIELGKELEPLEEKYKTDAFKVQGCMSSVWMICKKENGLLYFLADSDAMIVKGLLSIIIQVFSGKTPETIKNADFNLLQALELKEIITPGRQNGVASMLKLIKNYSENYS